MPDLRIMSARQGRLSLMQMPQTGIVSRLPSSRTPTASGGTSSARTVDAAPIFLRVVSPTTAEMQSAGELLGRAPDAALRVPVGTNLQPGDWVTLDDGRKFEALGAQLDVTVSTDERVLVVLIGARR